MKRLIIAFVLIMSGALASQAEIVYQPVPVDANSGFIEVGDPNSGQARIDYHYWQDAPSGYWHYSYQIFNNDYNGTTDDRTDDYHFGYEYDSGQTPDEINKFDLVFDPASGINDLEVLGGGGSTSGGTGWASYVDIDLLNNPDVFTGLDWAVTGSGGDTIAPAQWYTSKGGRQWNITSLGDASLDDSNGQYFQIASKWGPGWVDTSLVAGVSLTASGQVIGPSVIPEPASIFMCAIGAIVLIRVRRFGV